MNSIIDFSYIKKNLKKDYTGMQRVKVAILGDTPTQLLHQALRGYAYEWNLDIEIFEADIDQVDRQILDPGSDLYAFKPEFVLIYSSIFKLQQKFIKSSSPKDFGSQYLEHISSLLDLFISRCGSKVVYFNYPEFQDGVYGNFSNKTDRSFLYQVRKINLGLMDLALEKGNLFILDICHLQSLAGRNYVFNPSIYVNSGFEFSLDFLVIVVKNIGDIIQSIRGKFKKCLILDLDNTVWGGVIGDDGLENIQIGDLGIGKAYSQLQLWARQLKQRGIILCVCSKNTEEIAREPFEKHPEMILRMEDIAVFVANWDTKADNIRHIQSVLNIGFDSMVFIDDNPFERNFVRKELPEVCVPELPEDPAEYAGFLQTLNLFEISAVSENDEERTLQYQVEAKRSSVQKSFANEEEFLQSLEMKSVVKPFDNYDVPRVAQLSQRSNQFNLRTVRYTEDDIRKIVAEDDYITRSFTLCDKYGDYGLISLIILKKERDVLFIDTWLMSRRVLKRGMEKFVLNTLMMLARENNIRYVEGEYIPTPKNKMVENHYKELGFSFEEAKGRWVLEVAKYKDFNVLISTI